MDVYINRIDQFPALGAREQVSQQGGFNPVWANSGRELYYLEGEVPGVFVVATVRTETDCTVESREPLFSWYPMAPSTIQGQGRSRPMR